MAGASLPVVLAAVTVGLAVLVLPTWAPFLLADRVRALFGTWPTGSLAVNYVLAGLGVALAQAVTYVLAAAALGGVSTSEGPVRFFGVLIAANLSVPFAGWLVATLALPRRGSWDPTADGLDGRVVLAAGALWYAAVTSAFGVLLAFVLSFLFLPI